MTNRGIVSQISLTGQDGFDWSISQNVLLVNDWLTSHKYLTLVPSNRGKFKLLLRSNLLKFECNGFSDSQIPSHAG